MAAVIADSTTPFRYHGKLPDRARTREPPRIQILTVRPGQLETYVTTATQPGWNQPDQPAPAARLGWVSGKDKRYLMSWVWLGCSAIALVLVLWAKHVA